MPEQRQYSAINYCFIATRFNRFDALVYSPGYAPIPVPFSLMHVDTRTRARLFDINPPPLNRTQSHLVAPIEMPTTAPSWTPPPPHTHT